MTDISKVKAMQDANWKPSVQYWREEAFAIRAELDRSEARVAKLEAALVQSNDLLRSAKQVSARAILHEEFRVIANWDALHDQLSRHLKRHHELTNSARAALADKGGE